MDSNLKRRTSPHLIRRIQAQETLSSQFTTSYSPRSHYQKQSNVWDRLHSESASRIKKAEALQLNLRGQTQKRLKRVGTEPIECSLLRKHKEQQSRLDQMRAQQTAMDMAKMKDVPEINQVSKMLALANRGIIADRERGDSFCRHSPRKATPVKKPPMYTLNLQEDSTVEMEYQEIQEQPERKSDFYRVKSSEYLDEIKGDSQCEALELDDSPIRPDYSFQNLYEEDTTTPQPILPPQPYLESRKPSISIPGQPRFQPQPLSARNSTSRSPVNGVNLKLVQPSTSPLTKTSTSPRTARAARGNLSPMKYQFSFQEGFDRKGFYQRAGPVTLDYKNPLKR